MNIWEPSKEDAGVWPIVFVSCSQGWGVVANCFIVAQENYIYLVNRLQDDMV